LLREADGPSTAVTHDDRKLNERETRFVAATSAPANRPGSVRTMSIRSRGTVFSAYAAASLQWVGPKKKKALTL